MPARTLEAAELMQRFAERTGVSSELPQQRYLWTDAFALCNFLGLWRATGKAEWIELGYRLVDRVHRTLGRHRPDDPRSGWLSRLPDPEGDAHPTRGGLRIGKPLAERRPDESLDERLEWDRDGQYFHYLTKWMYALDQLARAASRPLFNAWAMELARAAHRGFVYDAPDASRRLVWKMSIDLTRPLVPSMGQHDPLDGYLSCVQLDTTAAALIDASPSALKSEAAAFAALIDPAGLGTADPLGIGGLLLDCSRCVQLERAGAQLLPGLGRALWTAALGGLELAERRGGLGGPAELRLGFRELGLAIGLHAAAAVAEMGADFAGPGQVAGFEALRERILSFWCEPAHREAAAWTEHRDINEVMLATALAPDGFVRLSPLGTAL